MDVSAGPVMAALRDSMEVGGSRMALTPSHRLVARAVLTRGPVSRTELSHRLGLSPASLTRLTKALLEQGLFREAEVRQAERSSRPVRPLEVDTTGRHFLGVNLSGDDLTLVVTNVRAEILATAVAPLTDRSPGGVVRSIGEAVDGLCSAPNDVLALGVCLGGNARAHRDVTRAPFLGWHEAVPLGDLLEDTMGIAAVVDNDVLALTRAEHWFGPASDSEHFAVITIGGGVGFGLVVHDRLVESSDAGLGLIGHYPLEPAGPVCVEGHRGCAQMLTISTITRRLAVALDQPVNYPNFLQLVANGHPTATAIAEEVVRALGRLVAAAANLTMAQRMILTGEAIGVVDLVRAEFDRAISHHRDPLADPLRLDIQPMDRTQWARGAAATAIQRYVMTLS